MTTLSDKRLKDPEYNLEIGTDEPNIRLILGEIEKAQQMANYYGDRNLLAFEAWHARWDYQARDGRKHNDPDHPEHEAFPWDGASDTRIRTVDEQIRDHVTVTEFAHDMAKIQAEPVRPFAPGRARQGSQGSRLLQWQVGTQIRSDVEREWPLAWTWMYGYGAALMGVDWWQCRRLEYRELTIPLLAEIVMAQTQQETGQPLPDVQALMQVQSALADPAQFEAFAAFIQSLSPIVTKAEARRAVEDLQQLRNTKIRVPYTYESQPRLTALRPGVDALWLDMTGDLQKEPWFVWRERVSETDLTDRIATENYDPRFVEAAIGRKGEGSDSIWLLTSLQERTMYGGYAPYEGWVNAHAANTIDLYHFFYKAHVRGTPALFRTIFNPAVTGRDLKNPLVAWHDLHPYDHGKYPVVPMRFEQGDRPITSSRGIAEIAGTWQQEEKAQWDGLVDRTSLVHRPPLVGPISREGYIRGAALPGSYLGVTRPNEFSWMPLPPPDQTPVLVVRAVAERVQRFFGIFGESVDPELKLLRRKQLAKKRMNEVQNVDEMIFLLDQQYFPNSEVEDIVGQLETPFQVSREEISARHIIVIKFDPRSIEEDYIKDRIGILDAAAKFNQGGNLNAAKAQRILLEMADPDLADEVLENDDAATERETHDELQAISNAMNGLESPLPLHANHQLRLQTLLRNTIQSPNPAMAKRLTANPDTLQILQKREEFFKNNIQQYQENPQIGRTLGGSAFSKKAPQMALPAGG
jgi:hypothetical protein